MKRTFVFAIMVVLFAACSTKEIDTQTPLPGSEMFYATFEQPAEDGTRVFANEDLLLRWTADDRVSIFNKVTYNQEYRFTGETGDNGGTFSKVGDEFATGNTISHIVSVYPYQKSTKISENENLTIELPAEQLYSDNTFGLGANTMVSVTSDNLLQYKNVGGYLVLKLYGEGVSVSSITLKGNNGEKLAGKANVTMPLDGVPSVVMSVDATREITLSCPTPVQLGATVEESTEFWFVIPHVTFEKGFTIVVNTSRGLSVRSTMKSLTIERNNLSRMASFEVDYSQPNNVIYYTSSDGNVVLPHNPEVFGASILSDKYLDGQGMITFDGDVMSIGNFAFDGCTNLASITIPEGVTSIGQLAFNNCSNLTSITIPDSVTSIGLGAFENCTSLTSVTIPDSVKSISVRAFFSCKSLTSITIPEGVTSIGTVAFSYCTSLTSITIPDSVTSIGDGAFAVCSSLTSITIPEGVTSIGDGAFSYCTSLTSIPIPDSVTSIGDGAFENCRILTRITIPDSVTSIGDGAFSYCTSLHYFNGKYSTTDGLFLINSGSIIAVALGAIRGEITIPDSVTSIGNHAFTGCSGLTNINIPDSVTSIGNHAFSDCSRLTSITIPDSVTSIGDGAFSYCTSLTSITVKSEVPPGGERGMFGNTNNCPIYVPAESVDAYKSAQYWSDYADRIQAIPSSVPIPEAVDLGLSVKWASFNLGATKPEDYGDYYAWGETEPYYSSLDPLTWKEGKEAGYGWPSYKWCNGSSNTLTKYCNNSSYGYNGFTDTKTVLDPEDDAAHVNLAGNWRIPTDAEFTELRKNCTWTWTTQNGVNGRLVTATNGNSIFLPAAGIWNETYLTDDVGSQGFYWSSSLQTGYLFNAWGISFSSGAVDWVTMVRIWGVSVRPVCD